jgi:hypothetical protein
MKRYFFNTRDGDLFTKDEEGSELPDLDAARHEAILAAREMMAEMLLEGRVVDGQVFEIMDEDDLLVAKVPFKSAMRLE